MKKHNHFCVLKGDPVIPGANRTPEGMNFAVEVPEAGAASGRKVRGKKEAQKWNQNR